MTRAGTPTSVSGSRLFGKRHGMRMGHDRVRRPVQKQLAARDAPDAGDVGKRIDGKNANARHRPERAGEGALQDESVHRGMLLGEIARRTAADGEAHHDEVRLRDAPSLRQEGMRRVGARVGALSDGQWRSVAPGYSMHSTDIPASKRHVNRIAVAGSSALP